MNMSARRWLLLTLGAFLGCGGTGSEPTAAAPGGYPSTVKATSPEVGSASEPGAFGVVQRPAFTLAANPPAIAIEQGKSATTEIQINRKKFSGAVSLAFESPLPGISGHLTPATLTGGTAVLEVAVAGTVVPGSYAVTVLGTATGEPSPSATIVVNVAPRADYALSVAGSVSIGAGASGQVAVNIARTNFTGVVSLGMVNPPVGFSGGFNPATTSGGNSVLTVSIAGTVVAGVYTLEIAGTAAGMAGRNATFTVSVTAPLPPAPPSPSADFSISLSEPTIHVTAGNVNDRTVNVIPVGNPGAISLALLNAPSGVTGSFAPQTLTSGNSRLDVIVAGSVAPGTYAMAVAGTAAGLPTRTASLTLIVLAAPPSDFGVYSTGTPTIPPGTTGQLSIYVLRANFTGPVDLVVTSAPPGITAVISPSTVTPNVTATMTVSVAPGQAFGPYDIFVKGISSIGERMGRGTVIVPLTNPPNPPPSGTFTLTSLSTVNASAGTSANLSIQIFRTDFTLVPINLSLESAPPGITGTFTPAAPTGNSATLQVTVAAGVQPGSYPVTIKGEAAGRIVTRPISVVVPLAGTFSLSVPSPRTVGQMTTAQIPVTITRTNFTGPVTLTLENPPPGMTGFFGNNPASGTSSSLLNLTVGVNVPAGTYALTIRGTSPGQADQTASLQVDVFVNFTLTASPSGNPGVLIYPGGTGTATITLNRGNFTGDVQLSIQSVPAGLSAAVVSPTLLSGSATTATLTVTSLPSYTGFAFVIVNGQSGTVVSQALVTVLSQWTQLLEFPTVSPNPVTVSQGSSTTATFSVFRSNYAGPFSVAVTGAPAGMNVSVSPQPVPGGSSSTTLTINAGASVPVGVYTLTVKANATGVKSDPVTFQVEVKP